jgi:hypothetical protein
MRIILDVFPAHLAAVPEGFTDDVTALNSYPATKDARYLATTRVVVTDTEVVVALDSPNGPVIAFMESYNEFLPGKTRDSEHRIVTKSGKMLAFVKDTNCGCGSRLRGWNPYNTLNSIKD